MLREIRKGIIRILRKIYRKIFRKRTRKKIRKIIKKIKKPIKKAVTAVYHLLLPITPTKRKMILFDSSTGINYTGSPRAVYERMVELGLDNEYECVWFFKRGKRPKEGLPGNATMVRY